MTIRDTAALRQHARAALANAPAQRRIIGTYTLVTVGLSLALTLALLLTLFGCSFQPPSILDDGAAQFGEGKEEENYSPVNTGALLDELIGKYSGSYQRPSGKPMDDDEFDNARDQVGKPEDPDPTAPTAPAQVILQVGSWEDLMAVFHEAYADTAQFVEFEIANGFSFDPYTDLDHCYRELQRQDPIYVSSVSSWSWGNDGDYYLFEIAYAIDIPTLIAMKVQTADLVDAAVAALNVTGKSHYEIIWTVNEYLCDTIYYPAQEPYAPETHTAYGALANGTAVCEGYALAAKLMLNELGIPCDIQTGTCTGGGGHAWNLVQLEGQWYQLDVTWNDGSATRQDYLLVTDAYMRKSRTWDYGNYPASAPEPYKP